MEEFRSNNSFPELPVAPNPLRRPQPRPRPSVRALEAREIVYEDPDKIGGNHYVKR